MELISTQKKETNVVELEIAVGAQELNEAAENVFRRKVKNLAVPGFRKGKAPRQIIEKMYGDDIFFEDAVKDLYPKVYGEAIEEANIHPVDKADVEILSIDKENGFTFKATVTVKPEIGVGKYKGIEAVKPLSLVEESEVDGEISKMRERGARIVTIEDRAAKEGDTAIIDFEGFIDSVPFEGGKAEEHPLELGSGAFIEGFEEQVAGHFIGDEFEVNVTFPEEYHSEELQGKPAVFKVTLREIKETQLPEIDDEFAKDVSEFDSIEELRSDLRAKLQEAKDKKSENELESKLVNVIVEGVTGDIPEVMFKNKVDDMVGDLELRLHNQKMNLDIYMQYTGTDMASIRNSFREGAERKVKLRLALEVIAEKEGFIPTPEEIEADYQKLAEKHDTEVARIKRIISEKDLSADLACEKAMEYVKSNAVINEC